MKTFSRFFLKLISTPYLKVVVVAVPVDGGERGHVEQEPRQGVEEVVVEVELRQLRAEGERVGDGTVLKAVVGEAQLPQPLEPELSQLESNQSDFVNHSLQIESAT